MTGRVCSPKYSDEQSFNRIVDYSCMNTMFESCVKQYGKSSVVVDISNHSFEEVSNDVAHFRAVLSEAGITRGKTVALYSQNSYEYLKAFFAITTLGATAVLVPLQTSPQTLLEYSTKYNLCAILYDNSLSENLNLIKDNPSVALIDLKSTSVEEVSGVDVESSDPCVVCFTGGTTGKNKGALLSHRAVLCAVKNCCYGYENAFNQRYLLVLPLTHVLGLIRTMLACFYTGSSLYICKNTKDMFRDISVHKPTILVLVPALAELAINLSKQFKRNMLGPDARLIICGGASVSPYLVKKFEEYNIILYPGYGLTESASLCAANPEPLKKPESVGFLYDDIEAKIVDGELWIRGPSIMDCYLNDPEETSNSFIDGWFMTGDLAKIDDEGFLYILGRKKEIIVLSNGENISPSEIEAEFNTLDCIQDSLVYASKVNGQECLVLQVLPRISELKASGISDIESFIKKQVNLVNKRLPSFKQISKLIIRKEDFVRSSNMKILRGKNGED